MAGQWAPWILLPPTFHFGVIGACFPSKFSFFPLVLGVQTQVLMFVYQVLYYWYILKVFKNNEPIYILSKWNECMFAFYNPDMVMYPIVFTSVWLNGRKFIALIIIMNYVVFFSFLIFKLLLHIFVLEVMICFYWLVITFWVLKLCWWIL